MSNMSRDAMKHMSNMLVVPVVQVIDHYKSKVVKLEAEKSPETVSAQIREALAKIKHAMD